MHILNYTYTFDKVHHINYCNLYCNFHNFIFHSCDLGYYGDPNVIGGGSCTPCNCSNNIDISDPRSCSSINGECLMCINNSTGERCEDCEEWFYGDAVEAKNCQGKAQNSELPTQKLIQHNTNLYSCISLRHGD